MSEVIYQEKEVPTDFTEFKKVIESRRSVRVYTTEPVPDQVVNEALDMALLAPNSSNLQPWEFYWVRQSQKREALVEACFSQPAAKTASVLIVCVARTKTWKLVRQRMLGHLEKTMPAVPSSVMDYYKKLVPLVYEQGFLNSIGFLKRIAFWCLGWFRPVPRGPFSRAGMELWAVKTSALACENLMLAFRAQGYDTCPMEGFDEDRVRRILNLPSDAVVTMIVSAGKRDAKGIYGPRIRFDRNLFVKEV